jgi:hypothetical protein
MLTRHCSFHLITPFGALFDVQNTPKIMKCIGSWLTLGKCKPCIEPSPSDYSIARWCQAQAGEGAKRLVARQALLFWASRCAGAAIFFFSLFNRSALCSQQMRNKSIKAKLRLISSWLLEFA